MDAAKTQGEGRKVRREIKVATRAVQVKYAEGLEARGHADEGD